MHRALTLLIALFLPLLASAQCKTWVKSDCTSLLGSYILSGKPATTPLSPGDQTEIMLTFYSKHEYKLVLCKQALLDAASFKVVDTADNLIFDAKKEGKDSFEFAMGATQQLKIQISIPESEKMVDNYDIACLSILIGLKP